MVTNAGAVPVILVSSSAPALGTVVHVSALAEQATPVEEALLLLADLEDWWGPAGELDALCASPCGTPVRVSAETVLLLRLTEAGPLAVDTDAHVARRTGPVARPGREALHAVAADLLAEELMDAGAVGALVGVGSVWRAVGLAPDPGGWVVPPAGTAHGDAVRLRNGAVVVPDPARRGPMPPGRGWVVAPQAWQAWRATAVPHVPPAVTG